MGWEIPGLGWKVMGSPGWGTVSSSSGAAEGRDAGGQRWRYDSDQGACEGDRRLGEGWDGGAIRAAGDGGTVAGSGEKGRLLEGQRRDRDGHGEVKDEEMGHVRGRDDRWDRRGDTDKNPGAEMWEPPREGRER